MSGESDDKVSTGIPGGPSPGTEAKQKTSEEIANEFKEEGNTFLKGRQLVEAIESYTKGIAACDTPHIRGPILGNRSQAYRRVGKLDAALADAEEAMRIYPTYARGHVRKAYVLKEKGDWAAVEKAIKTALELNLEFKGGDADKMKSLLQKAIAQQEAQRLELETKKKLDFVMEKLLGKWNGAVPPELGGGSQELDFKSETKVILTVPARQMPARLKLDVMKSPMWLDITIPIPAQPRPIEHKMPHLFEFSEDYNELHLMGPPDQGLQPGVELSRPTRIDRESKSYVKMTRGSAKPTDEELEIQQAVDELKGKNDEEKMLKYCQMMAQKLSNAVQKDGFKFEQPQPHWPEQEIKDKYTSMLKMSQYIFILEKYFGQMLATNVSSMVKRLPGATVPTGALKEAVDELRVNMIAAGMHKDVAPQAPAANEAEDPSKSGPAFEGHLFSDGAQETKESKSNSSSGMSSVSLVLIGALSATAIMGVAYYLFGGSSKKRGSK